MTYLVINYNIKVRELLIVFKVKIAFICSLDLSDTLLHINDLCWLDGIGDELCQEANSPQS